MFSTELNVAHVGGKSWRLTRPLVWEGKWEYMIVKSGFVTDFASIPRPVRWLLDNAGRNSEAAVLHDAVWRESQVKPDPRVDPWHADGIFRRALRETGSTALSRGLMWFAVRTAATVGGRLGKLGPSLTVKLLQLLGILLLGLISAALPTLIAIVGLVVYWIAGWVVAIVWHLVFERRNFTEPTNWPWPRDRRRLPTEPIDRDLLIIVKKGPGPDDSARSADEAAPEDFGPAQRLVALLEQRRDLSDADIDALGLTN